MSKEKKELDEVELEKVEGGSLTGGILPAGGEEGEPAESDASQGSILPHGRSQQGHLR